MTYRFLFILALAAWSLPSFVHADKKEDFSIIGVWMLKSETAPDGKVTPSKHSLRPEVVADAMKQVETEFYQSEFYMSFRRRIEVGENIKVHEWKELEQQLKVVYPRFSSSLYGLYNLSPTEYQMCLLLKIRTAPAEIATVLNKDKSTISSMRRRLYKKVFGKEGSGKDWDELILSL